MQKMLILFFTLGISGYALADMAAAQAALEAKDYPTALKILEDDAKRNNVEARYQLGILYRDGLGVKRDPAMALKWFEAAGEADWVRDVGKFGYPDAQYQAGLMYRDGIGTERDLEEAADLFEQAAKLEHGPSQAMFAQMLLRGEGTDQDYQEAYIWASLAVGLLSGKERKDAMATRDEAVKHLSPDELAEANQEIKEHGD